MKHLNAAIAAISVLAAPAIASAATPNHREPVSVAVSAQGLDLSRPEHIDSMRKRVARAISEACNPGDRLSADNSPDWQCRQEMRANAETAMNRMINAPANRIASN
ncbi:MAG: UrcA family protein [Sphingobium sp.]